MTVLVPSEAGVTKTETVVPSLVVGSDPTVSWMSLVPTRRTFVVSLVLVLWPRGGSLITVWTVPVILWGAGLLAAVAVGAVVMNRPMSTPAGRNSPRRRTGIKTTRSCLPAQRRGPVRPFELATVRRQRGNF